MIGYQWDHKFYKWGFASTFYSYEQLFYSTRFSILCYTTVVIITWVSLVFISGHTVFNGRCIASCIAAGRAMAWARALAAIAPPTRCADGLVKRYIYCDIH